MFPTADNEDISQVTSLAVKSTSPSDARNLPEDTLVSTQNNNRELTLNMLFKEMIFCLALALTTYGALHNTPTKVSKHPQAVRFFSPDSMVTDWYRGQLSHALTFVNNADISFVMYYAPWDAESQYVRGEFEKAATVIGDHVHFSAINCWNPGSECRLQHNKIPSWPILMAYTVNSRGVHYKGPRDAHSMVSFLELMMRPLKRVSSTEDLIHLLSYCDAVAVGYTPLTETSKFYNVWYHVSLKSREYDVVGEICFASVTSEELAGDLGVEIVPNARLMLWNDTKEYISDEAAPNAWNESSLMVWVLENFSQPVARITPLWKKSFTFEKYIDGNPILMLFTPLNPIYEQLPNYALMREVAMEYYNCKNNESSPWTTELIKLQQVQRLLYQQKDYVKFCQEYKFKKPHRKLSSFKKEIESQNNKYPWNNSTQKTSKNSVFNFFVKRALGIVKEGDSLDDAMTWSSLDWLQECSAKTFPAERSFYDNYEQCRLFEKSFNFVPDDLETNIRDMETTMLPFEDDPLSPDNLIQENIEHICKLMKFAQEFSPPIYPASLDDEGRQNLTNINGLACANNFSLNIIAMDSVHNHHFAESLGIDISSKKDRTALVILDSKHESQYVLSEEYSAKSVRDFIYNFTSKTLKRSLRTHVNDAAHTHYFGSDGRVERIERDNETVQIVDLTTKTFRRLVKTPGTLSIVLVCNGLCGAAWSRAAARGARLLGACGARARLARLDVAAHDLPAHYSAPHLPTVYVFPPHREGEADSRAWPAGERVSASGVLALALRSLAPPHRMRVRIALCSTAQSNTEKKSCLKDIREHVSSLINRNLKYWRRTENEQLRAALFQRLQRLHRVSLELSLLHTSDLNGVEVMRTSLQHSLSDLNKNWDIDISILRRNITRPIS